MSQESAFRTATGSYEMIMGKLDRLDYSVQQLVRDAARYRWLRSNLQFVNFEGLTCDTCDVGLDYAVDKAIRKADGRP